MSRRPLSTFALPSGALPALMRNGYTTVSELDSVSAEDLASELSITWEVANAILSAVHPQPTLLSSQLAFSTTQRWRTDVLSSSFVPSSNPSSQLLMPPPFALPNTQTAASLLASIPSHTLARPPGTPHPAQMDGLARLPLHVASLDALLHGGLPRGHMLEISGPPQMRKDRIALGAVRDAAAAGERVWWIDTQNTTTPRMIAEYLARDEDLRSDAHELINYTSIHTLPQLIVLMHNVFDAALQASHPRTHPSSSSFLGAPSSSVPPSSSPHLSSTPSVLPAEAAATARPPLSVLVLSSLSAPFHSSPDLSPSIRSGILDRIKTLLSRACASSGLRVITTTHLATKLLNADGSRGTFDTGAKAVMVPALGPGYLPAGRSYRVLIVPHSRSEGMLRLIMEPGRANTGNGAVGGVQAIREGPYTIVHGNIT